MSKQDWKMFYTFLSLNPNVLWATRAIGYYDLSIELEVPNADEFKKFVNDMKARFYTKIQRRDTISVTEEIMLSYFPSSSK